MLSCNCLEFPRSQRILSILVALQHVKHHIFIVSFKARGRPHSGSTSDVCDNAILQNLPRLATAVVNLSLIENLPSIYLRVAEKGAGQGVSTMVALLGIHFLNCWVLARDAQLLRRRCRLAVNCDPIKACINLLYGMHQHCYDRRTMPSTCL